MHEENNEAWTTYESKSRLVTLFRKPEDIIFPRSLSSTARQQLRVEDLDATRCPHCTPVHEFQRTSSISEQPHSSDALEHALAAGNFTVYQGGDLNEFFGCDVFVPKLFSEVCLVNDHYILVKIPESTHIEHEIQPEMTDKTFMQSTDFPTEPVAEEAEETQSGNKFVRYLQCGNGRNRRVTPIPMTTRPVDDSTATNWSTNGARQQVFKSRTKLKMEKPAANPASNFETTLDATELNTQASSERVTFHAPLQTSLDDQVDLEVHGRLESPPANLIATRKKSRTQVLPAPRRPFGLFFCSFLRSFRFRRSTKKSSNAKKKINAVVYKTFFVTWAKHRERSACPNCCVPKRSLRRTRSAIF